MRETTSQTSFRFSSATLTPGFWPGHFSASVMYGSDCFRKYTGLK